MSGWRLYTVAEDFVEQLQIQPPVQLRMAAAAAAAFAVKRTRLADPRLDAALAAWHDRKFGETDERSAVRHLTNELDVIAWQAQRTAERHDNSIHPYREAFARARAANAVTCALDLDPLSAAMEAVYEAHAAVADIEAIRTVVHAALAGSEG